MLHVTTTCPDLDSARQLARAALEARLAACANITPGVVSLFHWQGRIEDAAEVMLAFKTLPERRTDLLALIGLLHPYDLPVTTCEVVETTPEAAAWLRAETG